MCPVELFQELFIEIVYDMLVEETDRYTQEMKVILKYNVSQNGIEIFMVFLILSVYHTVPSEKITGQKKII